MSLPYISNLSDRYKRALDGADLSVLAKQKSSGGGGGETGRVRSAKEGKNESTQPHAPGAD